ncbi:uncharacterized protein A4U43_C05F26880 [Asparagus officinalis]|uniref:LysM domain-containing protein n=1 Tax=Asparagus officinalis TaxID=4686 RepID=A0A5P1EZA0_ASPOF|nr:uncharacterized protein A4U43_C05F26880 [Asparagus officinalis]
MFDATIADVTSDPISNPNYLFIRKNCSCLTSRRYFTNTTFTARQQGNAYSLVTEAYGALASFANSSRVVREGNVVGLRLYCGCSSGLWNYLMSYVMEEGDTVEGLASRFGVSMDSIETANGLDGPDGVVVGDVYYIPLNSVPGQPYVDTEISPAPVPAPAPTFSVVSGTNIKNFTWIVTLFSK